MSHMIIRLTISLQLVLLAIIQCVSGTAVLPLMSYLADGMGHCVAMFTGTTTIVVGPVLQAVSQNVGMFIAFRCDVS